MVRKSGHPLGMTGRVLFGRGGDHGRDGVGVRCRGGGSAGQSTEDSRPASPVDVRTMTDQELGRVSGKDSLREKEVVTEMTARGAQFWETAPPPDGIGIPAGVPVRPGVSVTGTIARFRGRFRQRFSRLWLCGWCRLMLC
jgi:hypothetical protein